MSSNNATEVSLIIGRERPTVAPEEGNEQREATGNNNNNNNEKFFSENPGSSRDYGCNANEQPLCLASRSVDERQRNVDVDDVVAKSVVQFDVADDKALTNSTENSCVLEEMLPGNGNGDVFDGKLFRKCRFSVRRETVIATRIDGVDDATGVRSTLYKCHLCGKLASTIDRLRRHLAVHCRNQLPNRCPVCEARFRIRPQLSLHLKTQHRSFFSDADGALRVDRGRGPAYATNGFSRSGPERAVSDRTETHTHVADDRSDSRFSTDDSVFVESAADRSAAESSSSVTSVLAGASHDEQDAVLNLANCFSKERNNGPFSSSPENVRSYSSKSNGVTHEKKNSSFVGNNASVCERNRDEIPESRRDGGRTTAEEDSTVESPFDHIRRVQDELKLLGVSTVNDNNTEYMDCTDLSVVGSSADSSKSDLASKIRRTENLGDDVTVVIPSDAPLDGTRTTSKGSTSSRTCSDADPATPRNKIVHAPAHRSILGHPQLRSKRKPGLSVDVGVSAATTTDTSSSWQPKSVDDDRCRSSVPQVASSSSGATSSTATSSSSMPLSIYSPLALSSFVQGFNGLMSSPLLSPIIAQTSLGFPGMLISPLSLYAAAQLTSGSFTTMMKNGLVATSSTGSREPPSSDGRMLSDLTPAEVNGLGRIKEELSPPGIEHGKSSASEGYGNSSESYGTSDDCYANPHIKCSSLSRTHSRLDVVNKPIKRESAYKPVIMSDGRTAYHCLYCNKNFCTMSDVNRHMDFHEDIRPYKCRFCNYYARTNSQLKVHMMRHQGIREFLCRLCNYKGVTQSDLNRHTKSQIHMMKERNVCVQCHEGFVSPMNLEQHRREKHNNNNNNNRSNNVVVGNNNNGENNNNNNNVRYHLMMAGLVKDGGGGGSCGNGN